MTIIRVAAEGSLATQPVNVWHWYLPDVARVTEANAAVDKLDTFYTAISSILTAQTWTIGRRVVTVDEDPNEVVSAGVETSSSGASGSATLAAAAVLQLSGSFVGPRYRGRIFLGPVAPSVVNSDGRTVATAARNTILSAAASLMTPSVAGEQLVVWSRKYLTFTPVTVVGLADVVGVQRRRLT